MTASFHRGCFFMGKFPRKKRTAEDWLLECQARLQLFPKIVAVLGTRRSIDLLLGFPQECM